MKIRLSVIIVIVLITIACKSSQQPRTDVTENEDAENQAETEAIIEPAEPEYKAPKIKTLDSIKAKMSTNLPKKG